MVRDARGVERGFATPADGAAGDELDFAAGECSGAVDLVGHHHDGAVVARSPPEDFVEHQSPDEVEPGVRLVEQQQSRVTRQRDREAQAPLLTGREVAVRDRRQPSEIELLDQGAGRGWVARRLGGEVEVLGDGQVVVAERLVADERELVPNCAAVEGQVMAEHGRRTRAQRQQPGEEAQQRRLPRAVGTGDEDDLARIDIEVDTRECGEPAEEADHGAKLCDAGHGPKSFGSRTSGGVRVYGWNRKGVEPRVRPTRVDACGRNRHNAPLPSTLVRTAIGALGRVLITVGLLILLFVAYQLWGTGIYTARAQDQLEREFDDKLAEASTTTTTTAAPATTPPPPPPGGEAVARITIPKIGLDSIVVSGVTEADLRKGPGHYPQTPMPGQLGNAAIAGHRTTYGQPFHNLDQLAVGDEILVTTLDGTFTYTLDREPFAVAPTQVDVLLPEERLRANGTPTGRFKAQLTLTTCNPKYSASERLIVKAELDTDESPPPKPSTASGENLTLDAGLSGEGSSEWPMVIWGAVLALVGGTWWLLFHRYPRWTTWLVGVIPFVVVLFLFYTYLERLLPANY